jgi:Domain of unknown function (DUF6378)
MFCPNCHSDVTDLSTHKCDRNSMSKPTQPTQWCCPFCMLGPPEGCNVTTFQGVPCCERCRDKLKKAGLYDVAFPAAQPHASSPENVREKLRRERGARYGDVFINQSTIGQMYTAMLEQHYQISLPHPIPGSLAAAFMVLVKLNRAAFSPNHADNFDDAHNYLDFVQECQQKETENEKEDSANGGQHRAWKNRLPKAES